MIKVRYADGSISSAKLSTAFIAKFYTYDCITGAYWPTHNNPYYSSVYGY